MQIRSGLLCVVTLLFAGCGDDGSPSDTELSGEFQAGRVSGLRYVTPTRSGVTDSNGTFKYLAGESVTFSVGAIALGHAPGAAQITPFTLAGMTPPTTELALRRELDRASRTTSNFVHAVNLMRLSLALDVDHDPANGIDLRGRDAALASATLNLIRPFPNLWTSREARARSHAQHAALAADRPFVSRARNRGAGARADELRLRLRLRRVFHPDYHLHSTTRMARWNPGASFDGLLSFGSSISYGYDALGRMTYSRNEQDIFSGSSSAKRSGTMIRMATPRRARTSSIRARMARSTRASSPISIPMRLPTSSVRRRSTTPITMEPSTGSRHSIRNSTRG